MQNFLAFCHQSLYLKKHLESFTYMYVLFIFSVMQIEAKSFFRVPVKYSIRSEFEEEPLAFRIDRNNGNLYRTTESFKEDRKRFSMIVTAKEDRQQLKAVTTRVRLDQNTLVYP